MVNQGTTLECLFYFCTNVSRGYSHEYTFVLALKLTRIHLRLLLMPYSDSLHNFDYPCHFWAMVCMITSKVDYRYNRYCNSLIMYVIEKYASIPSRINTKLSRKTFLRYHSILIWLLIQGESLVPLYRLMHVMFLDCKKAAGNMETTQEQKSLMALSKRMNSIAFQEQTRGKLLLLQYLHMVLQEEPRQYGCQ